MDEKIVKKIWDSMSPISGKDTSLYRKDISGNIMYYPSYGKKSDMGWLITKKDGRKTLEESNIHAIAYLHDKKTEKKTSRKAK
ncbi:hypothetical protein BMW23_0191 [Bodo saltans virus]|jgi:hypothetical protein|uniref:Uncharacterized protein n=1 Tax=Bodo saltans virus TaxID=2024608 RepID=A0A2H4UTT3_9VIRU|nr:hypothetical protein QJ851_gp0186 [Bodo saltans virus]ATZ80249.1 hypothetical protein BMW23_0191 [Bodo saltans virus]